jgi:hypothetical protein
MFMYYYHCNSLSLSLRIVILTFFSDMQPEICMNYATGLSIAATLHSDGTTMAAILTKSARVDETEMKRRREDGGIKQMDNGMLTPLGFLFWLLLCLYKLDTTPDIFLW